MQDWNAIDAQAANEAQAIGGGFRMGNRHHRSRPSISRQSISTDYRVREKAEKSIDKLAQLNVIGGRKS